MTKNRDPQPHHEATSEQEESETETQSESDSESESQPLQTPVPTKPGSNPSKNQLPTQQLPQTNSKEDIESGSDSDSEESSENEIHSKTELVKAVQKPPSTKKPQTSSSKPPSNTLTGTKRVGEANGLNSKDDKKVKKKHKIQTESQNEPKKVLFQRIWSQNDEIILLKGILAYVEEKDADPYVEVNSFHDSIKKKLQVTLTKEQVRSKIRALMKKFQKKQTKEEGGEDLVFSQPHEHECYVLSKKIWGNADMKFLVGTPHPKSSGQAKTKKKNKLPEAVADCHTLRGSLNFGAEMEIEKMIHMRGRKLFEGENVVEGSKTWRNCILRKMEIHMEAMKLKMETMKLKMETLKVNMDMTKLVFDATKAK